MLVSNCNNRNMEYKDLYDNDFNAILKIAVKKILGTQTADPLEEEKFRKWLDSDPANNLLYESLKDSSKIEQLIDLANSGFPERQVKLFRKKVSTGKSIFHKKLFRYPAAASLLLGAYLMFNMFQNSRIDQLSAVSQNSNKVYVIEESTKQITVIEDSSISFYNPTAENIQDKSSEVEIPKTTVAKEEYKSVVVPKGKEIEVLLPDGSKVWLGAGSTLSFQTTTNGKTREVLLEGEAYFDVVSMSGKPFIVKTSDISTKVYGTEFYISALAHQTTTAVSLLEGSVEVTGKGNNSVMLLPGQKAISDKSTVGISVEEFNIGNLKSIREGMFVFWGERVADILPVLNNWFDYQIICENDALNHMKFYLKIDKETPVSDVMNMLSRTNLVKYRVNNFNKTIKLTLRD
jgi:ferric-dicitrate binding protein FerR (iron transport regulator)